MATPFHLPVTAAQVGTYFVGHYYQVLQTQPDYVHQFYTERSTLLRVDGHNRETATSMLQIHAIVMSLNYTGIEIKTVHALESWDRGVLVLVAGSVHVKDYNGRRTFVQTFFLAPQEKGYFVLNDIFHFTDDQPFHHPVAYVTQNDLVSKMNGSIVIQEQASSYMVGGDVQAFVPPTTVAENGNVNNYSFQEQQLQVPESESVLKDNYAAQTNGSVPNTLKLQDHSTPVVEVVGEPQKHTYASILQVAKGHSAQSAPREQPVTKSKSPSELNHVIEQPAQQSTSAQTAERSGAEAMEDISMADDEGEMKSVYVKNVPSTANPSDIEVVFKKFGKIRQDGVAIRTRKDLNVCYAFVEYEDMTGVNNAIKASTAEICGKQVYIEGRRANRSNVYRGGRERGRGRGGYQADGRGRFGGRNYSRSNGHDGNDHRDHNRTRGNGYYRQTSRQDQNYSNSQQAPKNGHITSD
uniref:nuclear transport factor 2-like n=1 Tax=Erigeron canadensis TaxID=72917 RepID=UPI001CB8A74E|nr:nuclear transport factor 2-like [Erigeron canadensis]